MFNRISFSLALICALGLAAILGACDACHPLKRAATVAPATAEKAAPTLRLYMMSDVAGALEPCGCVKDQLGGLDHLAAWVASEKKVAPSSILVTAGPLFFTDPTLAHGHQEQDVAKAQMLARGLHMLGLGAFAPGWNDWAAGAGVLDSLVHESGGAMLTGAESAKRVALVDVGGVKVGFIGLIAPPNASIGPVEPPFEIRPPMEVARAAWAEVEKLGPQVTIALVSTGRGEAKRIAEELPNLTAILVGSAGDRGEENTTAPPVDRVGNVLIAQTGNHMQSVAMLDLYVRGGSYAFADADGVEAAQKRDALNRRVRDLRVRIATWERDGKIGQSDIEKRRADVAQIEGEIAASQESPSPPQGSYFKYAVKDIRDNLGSNAQMIEAMKAYYRAVNDQNKQLFAARVPPAPTAGKPSYVGVDVCTGCHAAPRAVWNKTAHSRAYATLANQFKEFNLDCVSCHVTGYDAPGGSTVTHVERLKNVQCETCHGPGSAHAATANKKLIQRVPSQALCISCHKPPHVHEFDVNAKWGEILGPGHGHP